MVGTVLLLLLLCSVPASQYSAPVSLNRAVSIQVLLCTMYLAVFYVSGDRSPLRVAIATTGHPFSFTF